MSNDLNVSFIDKGTIFLISSYLIASHFISYCVWLYSSGVRGGDKGQSLRWFTLSGPFSFSFECDIELILKR